MSSTSPASDLDEAPIGVTRAREELQAEAAQASQEHTQARLEAIGEMVAAGIDSDRALTLTARVERAAVQRVIKAGIAGE